MFSRRPENLPTADAALPGRAEPLPTAEKHFVNGNPLKGPYPDGFKTAVFAMGCYWGVERRFWQVPGVWVTAVGNAGGHTPNPTYEEVCSGKPGHTESVFVVYDYIMTMNIKRNATPIISDKVNNYENHSIILSQN